jgi:hypothetical protein
MPTHKVIHIYKPHEPSHKPKLAKEYAFLNAPIDRQLDVRKEQRRHNSTYPKVGVSCSKDSFVVAESSAFRMKFSGKNPAHRVAAKR